MEEHLIISISSKLIETKQTMLDGSDANENENRQKGWMGWWTAYKASEN